MANFVKLISVAFLTLAIFSCSSFQENNGFIVTEVESIAASDTLYSNVYHFTEKQFLFPNRIENINDQFLIAIEPGTHDRFNVFSLPDLNFLYSFGSIGRGPGEVSSIITFPSASISKPYLIVHDPVNFRLIRYGITDDDIIVLSESTIRYDTQDSPLNGLTKVSDSLFIAFYGTSDREETNHEFVALQPDNEKSLFTFGNYPDTDLTAHMRAQHFVKTVTSKPDGQNIAAFYMNHPYLKIYDNEGMLLNYTTIGGELSNQNLTFPASVILRSQSRASDNYIFVLRVYATLNEMESKYYRPIIEVWDWNGNPLSAAVLDKPVSAFTVSEVYNKIFAISSLEENRIFEYDLSNLIDF